MTTTSPATPATEIERVAILGMGAMGSRMAARVAQQFDVVVWNRSPEHARQVATEVDAEWAPTVAEAVHTADVVLTMVADDNASREVLLTPDGVLASVRPGTAVVEASTVSPDQVRRLAAAATEAGIDLIEAPVVGSRPQAETGALVSLVGGDGSVVDRVQPVLATTSAVVHHTGPVGTAATMKLAVNGLFAMQVAAYAETVGLLERSDIDTSLATEILGGLPITAPGLQRILGLIADRAFSPNFPVALVAKDLDYLNQVALAEDADTPMARAAESVFRAGVDEGRGALDIAGIASRYVTV